MLSIIVPVRNESDNLQSVFDYFSNNLKNLNYEVLIINDYSEDNTLDKIKKLADKHKEFKVLIVIKVPFIIGTTGSVFGTS